MSLQSFLKARAMDGVSILRVFYQLVQESSADAVAVEFGYRVAEINRFLRAYRVFRDPQVKAAAQAAQLSLTTALDLAVLHRKLPAHRDKVADMITLCQLITGLTADEAKAAAIQQVAVWRADCTPRPDYARFHTEVGADGKRRLTAAFRDDVASEMDTALHRLARKIQGEAAQELDYESAYAQALQRKVLGSGTDEQPPKFGPMFLIALDAEYFADGHIATTDGALVDLKEVIDTELADTGWAAVLAKGPNGVPDVATLVQVERTWPGDPNQRFANESQRLIGIIETLKCAWPGCSINAATCEAHHVLAHKLGGPTTQTNLVMACKPHNSRNDDDPKKDPKNGRLERNPITGEAGWRLKPEDTLRHSRFPVVAKGTRAYAKRRYQL